MDNTNLRHVSSGICFTCKTCQQDWGYDNAKDFERDVDNGVIVSEPYFSWSHCELCDCSLGGNRESAHAIDSNNDLLHIEICEDCVLNLPGY